MPDGPRRIGRYEVIRPIAAGDTAELFLAKQVGLEGFERVVFVKRIRDELAAADQFVKSFLEEARLVAKLSHPNIVEVYDLGKDGEAYFVAMEYVQGRTLARVAARASEAGTRLTPQFVARCISETCAGLQYAHTMADAGGTTQNIIHGAMSPKKILVSFSGVSKVRDFGIAKAATILAETRVGLFKGRYAYMSPEQVRRMDLDARADVFSLGILLYELLAGTHPFKRGNSILTLTAIAEEKHPPVTDVREDLPKKLVDIVDRTLSKRRSKRFSTAAELQAALEDYLSEAPRCDSVEVRRTLNALFAEELISGLALLDIPGVGEVILPEGDAATVARPKIVPDDTTTIGPQIKVAIDADTEIAPFHEQDTALGGAFSDNFDQESTAIPVEDVATRNFGVMDADTRELPELEDFDFDLSSTSQPSVIRDPAESSPDLDAIAESALHKLKKVPHERTSSDLVKPAALRQPTSQLPEIEIELPQPKPKPVPPDRTHSSMREAIADAFEEFALAPKEDKEDKPEELPVDALVPLEPDPPGTPKLKRDIVEVHRPGPQAPTEFRSGLAEEAEAILRGATPAPEPVVFIPHLPSIIRVRDMDENLPKVEVIGPNDEVIGAHVLPPPAPPKVAPTPRPMVQTPKPAVPPPEPVESAEGHFSPGFTASKLQLALPETREFPPPETNLPAHIAEPLATPVADAHEKPRSSSGGLIAGLPPKVLLAITGLLLAIAFGLLLLTVGGSDGARVNVRSNPGSATVTVNGQVQPTTTPLTFEGKPGATYQVRVDKEGYISAYKTIIVPHGARNVLVEVDLQK